MTNKTLPPFSCTHSPNLPELLLQLNCTIVISTYQAGKVIFISAPTEDRLVQLPRTFDRVMGIALDQNKLALAAKDEIIVLANDSRLAPKYPKKPGTYDALFAPRLTYYTGQIDIHDLNWIGQDLIGVNTSFSCLIKASSEYSWEPIWKPPFIDSMVSEDRCHLNGMAVVDGEPKYVTALGKGNTFKSWKKDIPSGGILMNCKSDEILIDDLPMPHSPRWFDQSLYLLLSATGEIIKVDVESGEYEIIKKLNGFVRGLAKHGDYLFIGLSKLRSNSSIFKNLAIAKFADKAGVVVMHLPTKAIVAQLNYLNSVDEIFDIQILPGKCRPGILNTISPMYKYGLSIPSATYWAKDIPENV